MTDGNKNIKSKTKNFYNAVRKEHVRMSNIYRHGVRLYSEDYILATLGEKFYRSPKTIENIVYYRVKE